MKSKIYKWGYYYVSMEMITIPKPKFERMEQELEILRNSELYKRLLQFEQNIMKGKVYIRKDLGF